MGRSCARRDNPQARLGALTPDGLKPYRSSMPLSLELRPREEQTALNLRRWEEILADPQWHKVEGRVEIDRHGRVTVIPPLPVQHGSLEATVGIELQKRMSSGTVVVVCPLSTVRRCSDARHRLGV